MADGQVAAIAVPPSLRRDLAELTDRALDALLAVEDLVHASEKLIPAVEYLASDPDDFYAYLEASGMAALDRVITVIYDRLWSSGIMEGGALTLQGAGEAEATVWQLLAARRAQEGRVSDW